MLDCCRLHVAWYMVNFCFCWLTIIMGQTLSKGTVNPPSPLVWILTQNSFHWSSIWTKLPESSQACSQYFYKILRKKGVNVNPFGAQEYKDYGYQVQCNVIEVQFVDEVSFDALRVCMFGMKQHFLIYLHVYCLSTQLSICDI